MAEIELPGTTAQSLDFAIGFLDGDPPAEELRLAGGTVLAAKWKHRMSTDIDLVCGRNAFLAAMGGGRRMELVKELRRLRDEEGHLLSGMRASRNFLGWNMPSGPVSLVPTRIEDFPRLWTDDVAKGTNVRLATTEAILHGKIFGRLVGGENALARDGYDFAVAMLVEREKVDWLLRDDEDREQVANAVFDAQGTLKGGKSLDEAVFPEIAKDPWREALRILEERLGIDDYERTEVPNEPMRSASRFR